MSKNLVMRRNDGVEEKANSVERLQTSGDWGAWVPEDETSKTGEITITELGTYLAFRDGLYGYSKVHVNIQFPQHGTTRGGTGYEIYKDFSGNPHLSVTKVKK